jgi:hypothetical protein
MSENRISLVQRGKGVWTYIAQALEQLHFQPVRQCKLRDIFRGGVLVLHNRC